jgi:regulatory protein
MKRNTAITPAQAWIKAQKYCAYQERCHQEVRNKLYELGLRPDEVENIIVLLIEENFLNEERFARAYAGGKFRTKKWGRVKIMLELKARKISPYCIKEGMKEIDDVQYYEQMKALLYKKWDELKKEKNVLVRKHKTGSYLMAKGYEPDLVWDAIKELSKNI